MRNGVRQAMARGPDSGLRLGVMQEPVQRGPRLPLRDPRGVQARRHGLRGRQRRGLQEVRSMPNLRLLLRLRRQVRGTGRQGLPCFHGLRARGALHGGRQRRLHRPLRGQLSSFQAVCRSRNLHTQGRRVCRRERRGLPSIAEVQERGALQPFPGLRLQRVVQASPVRHSHTVRHVRARRPRAASLHRPLRSGRAGGLRPIRRVQDRGAMQARARQHPSPCEPLWEWPARASRSLEPVIGSAPRCPDRGPP